MNFLFRILALWTLLSHNNHYRILADAQTIPEVVQEESELATFSTGIELAGLTGLLSTPGPYTVFGPDNNAFTAIDSKYFEPEWQAHLTEIMLQHVVQGPPFQTQFWEVGIELVPLSGGGLAVTQISPTYQINDGVTVVTPDIPADNGVIHVMDTVILPPSAQDSIMDIISVIPDFFSTLAGLLEQTGLDQTLRSDGPFTVFAPSNEAFAKLSPDEIAVLQTDTDALTELLEYHIVPGIYLVEDLQGDDITTLPTLQGTPLPKPLSSIQFVDLLATNGVMHIVNEVLFPPDGFQTGAPGTPIETPAPEAPATEAPGTSPPTTGVPATPAPTTETPATLAPTTEVPATSPPTTELPATEPPTTEAPVTEAPATKAPTTAPAETVAPTGVPSGSSIAEIAIDSNFTVFVDALNMTGLLEQLNKTGPYTVFAVPNDGFDDLPAKFLEDEIWSSHLTNVLTYHMIPQVVLEANLTENTTIATLNFNSITVTNGDPLQINGINVTETDINADNGVVHVMEEVLLPPSATDTAEDLFLGFDQFSTFYSLINATGLNNIFNGTSAITVFAPMDSAFNALPEGTIETLLAEDPDALREILLYHVAPDIVEFAPLTNDASINVTTVQSSNVTFANFGGVLTINDAQVNFQDLLVQNGIVQVIDRVLIPPEEPTTASPTAPPTIAATTTTPTAMATEATTTTPTAMATEASSTASPTTAATTTAPTVTATGTPTFASMQTAVPTMPPAAGTASPTVPALEQATTAPGNFTVMDVIRNEPDLSTLNELLIGANLEETLEGPGPFTIFAPSNDAFDALPPGLLDSLLDKPANFENVLLYHVIAGEVLPSPELNDGEQIPTAQGSSVAISIDEGDIKVNQAAVVVPNLFASNGVVHIIDTLLIPPAGEPPAKPPTGPPEPVPGDTEPPAGTGPSEPVPADTEPPTETPVAQPTTIPEEQPTSMPVVTVAPSDEGKCVSVPGQHVCCPPGETTGVFFFCRYL